MAIEHLERVLFHIHAAIEATGQLQTSYRYDGGPFIEGTASKTKTLWKIQVSPKMANYPPSLADIHEIGDRGRFLGDLNTWFFSFTSGIRYRRHHKILVLHYRYCRNVLGGLVPA